MIGTLRARVGLGSGVLMPAAGTAGRRRWRDASAEARAPRPRAHPSTARAATAGPPQTWCASDGGFSRMGVGRSAVVGGPRPPHTGPMPISAPHVVVAGGGPAGIEAL